MSAPRDACAYSNDAELNSSKLGTKEHWDETYDTELKNFTENGDVGEVWFGEDSIERVIKWMDQSSLISEESSVMDLGCGNGLMLVELHKRGYTQLYGVDYAQGAVDLAKAIADKEDLAISYERGDIVESPMRATSLQKRYMLCIDKGTYDAISLCPEDPAGKRAAYVSNVCRLLVPHGLLLITSCNWTQEELLQHFTHHFDLLEKIPTPTFSFGGSTGNRETSLVLQKRDQQ